jgi:hypothetical protein
VLCTLGLEQRPRDVSLDIYLRQRARKRDIEDAELAEFVLERVQRGPLDLVILDNFSTLGEVEDETAAPVRWLGLDVWSRMYLQASI